MFTVNFHFDMDGFKREFNEIVQKEANAIVNKRLAPIKDEIDKEPEGKFIGTMKGDVLSIKPEGFSPELTEKINELFKEN